MIIGLDPGNEKSALVIWDEQENIIFDKLYCENDGILHKLSMWRGSAPLVIEMIASYGMAVGATVFETCVWIGRFMQTYGADRVTRVPRIQIKNHLCHTSRAKDANVRQAIIDRFGGKDKAVGTKKAPGPLYQVSGDLWAALSVALWYADTEGRTWRTGK